MPKLSELLSGIDESAAQDTQDQANRNRAYIERLSNQAKNEALGLFSQSQNAMTTGLNQAMDVQQGALTQAGSAFNQGNRNAQATQVGGLNAYRDALMGNNVDLHSWGAPQIDVNADFMNQRLGSAQLPQELQGLISGRGEGSTMGNVNFDWRNYLGQEQNQDLLSGFNTQEWTNDPRQWGEEWWMKSAQQAGDPRIASAAGRAPPSAANGTLGWQGFIDQYPDLQAGYDRASGWANTPREWGEGWWMDEAKRVGDPRYEEALSGII